jgi:hypothetical protein
MAEGDEHWPTLEEWLEEGHDLQDLPMRPDGKQLRELTNVEVRERVLAHLDQGTRNAAAARLFARLDSGGELSDSERRVALSAFADQATGRPKA